MSEKIMNKLVKLLAYSKAFRIPRQLAMRILKYCIASKQGVIIRYSEPERAKILDLIHKIRKETELLITDNEAYQIFMAAERTGKIKGDIAEVGVYKGGSSKLICAAKKDKALHLFDTFEGIPEVSEIDKKVDNTRFFKGQFNAQFEEVKRYLSEFKNVYFYKGLFPETAKPIKNKKFSFVNLDVDTHKSTKQCLEFFYPRMSRGGIILSHDYISAEGVKKAFDDFFKDKPEPIIEMSGLQCLVVKL